MVDVQEKLVHAVHESSQLIKNCQWLLRVANQLHIPCLVSEQYPKGLGKTISELEILVSRQNVLEKLHFSCLADPDGHAFFAQAAKSQIIIMGIESHVCVLQTAIDLLHAKYTVFVVSDAVSSRNPLDKEVALARLRDVGVQIVSKEMVLFEWARQAGTAQFKQLSRDFLQS
jgi:nicotinamidase-related amidase